MKFCKGDILQSEAQAIVNPVNCVGVMGAGLAKQFKEKHPGNYHAYSVACRRGDVEIGSMFCTTHFIGYGDNRVERTVINFPTKLHWRDPSKLEYIEKGLEDLVDLVYTLQIESIAIPPLGCGLGGLNKDDVLRLMLDILPTGPEWMLYNFETGGKV